MYYGIRPFWTIPWDRDGEGSRHYNSTDSRDLKTKKEVVLHVSIYTETLNSTRKPDGF